MALDQTSKQSIFKSPAESSRSTLLGFLRRLRRQKKPDLNDILKRGRARIYEREGKDLPLEHFEAHLKFANGKRQILEAAGMEQDSKLKPKNADYVKLWASKGFRFSYNRLTGEASIVFSGGIHFEPVFLEDHDIAELAAILLYLTYRNEPKNAALKNKRPTIPLNILSRMREVHDRVHYTRNSRNSGDN